MIHRFRSLIAALCLSALPAWAGDLPAPTGPVLLTVSGAVSTSNTEGGAALDLAQLAALPTVEIITTTIWTEGPQTFTGVPLSDLLAHVGATGSSLSATAINDYAIEIPMEEAMQPGPIVAYMRNGKPMPVRDKGPLWIVYPYDSDPEFRSEVIYSRSIWQLDRIVVND